MTTYTLQGLQANLGGILDDMDAGTVTSVDVIKTAGASTVAKLVRFATYDAANIAGTDQTEYVSQQLLQSGPMSQGSNGLYKLTKTGVDAVATPDATTHATLQFTDGAGGVLFTAVRGGVFGNTITVEIIDPGVLTASTTVVVVGTAIAITLACSAAPAVVATMQDVVDAVAASATASALVTAATTGVAATLAGPHKASLAYSAGAGGVTLLADTAGTGGNAITYTVVNPVTLGSAHYSYPDGVQGGNGIDLAAVTPGLGGDAISVEVINPATLANAYYSYPDGVQGGNGIDLEAVAVGVGGAAVTVEVINPATLGNAYYSYPDGVQGGNGLDFEAVAAGPGGAAITVTVVDPGGDGVIGVGVVGTDITVTLAYALGAVTSTLTDVKNALDGDPGASALITTTITGVAGTLATAMAIQNLILTFPLTVGAVGDAITIELATDASGVITTDLTGLKGGIDGTPAVAALITATITGVAGTLATAMAVQNLILTFPLTVGAVGDAVTIDLATDASGVITTDLTALKAGIDGTPAVAALITATITGVAGTLATAMAVQNLSLAFPLTVGAVVNDITVELATSAAGAITTDMTALKAGMDGTPAVAALVDTTITGVAGTLATAQVQTSLAGGTVGVIGATPLAGGAPQAATAPLFKTYAIYRKRTHSRNAGIAPSLTPRAVLISKTHATFLGL